MKKIDVINKLVEELSILAQHAPIYKVNKTSDNLHKREEAIKVWEDTRNNIKKCLVFLFEKNTEQIEAMLKEMGLE